MKLMDRYLDRSTSICTHMLWTHLSSSLFHIISTCSILLPHVLQIYDATTNLPKIS